MKVCSVCEKSFFIWIQVVLSYVIIGMLYCWHFTINATELVTYILKKWLILNENFLMLTLNSCHEYERSKRNKVKLDLRRLTAVWTGTSLVIHFRLERQSKALPHSQCFQFRIREGIVACATWRRHYGDWMSNVWFDWFRLEVGSNVFCLCLSNRRLEVSVFVVSFFILGNISDCDLWWCVIGYWLLWSDSS